MKSFERPSKWIYTLEPFTQENQFLTPKMSLRRNNILKVFMPQIDALYDPTTASTAGVSLKDYGVSLPTITDA